jgi:hypothetical protein
VTQPRPFRLLVTATRENRGDIRDAVRDALNEIAAWVYSDPQFTHMVVVHGDCVYGGGDRYADEWAFDHPPAVAESHPARNHRTAPDRNTHMVSLGADLCAGFPGPGSRGTWDTLRKACDAGIPLMVRSVGP